jgi:hypothetical protein
MKTALFIVRTSLRRELFCHEMNAGRVFLTYPRGAPARRGGWHVVQASKALLLRDELADAPPVNRQQDD